MRALQQRRALSVVEVATAALLLAMLVMWSLPRLSQGGEQLAGDVVAQTNVELAVEAVLALKRENGQYPTGSTTAVLGGLERYLAGAALTDATTTTMLPGQVSVAVVGGTTADIAAAAVAPDGVCWMARRAIASQPFEVVYATASFGHCNAQRASSLTPDPLGPGRSWSKPRYLLN
jgi:hypothetical protein